MWDAREHSVQIQSRTPASASVACLSLPLACPDVFDGFLLCATLAPRPAGRGADVAKSQYHQLYCTNCNNCCNRCNRCNQPWGSADRPCKRIVLSLL